MQFSKFNTFTKIDSGVDTFTAFIILQFFCKEIKIYLQRSNLKYHCFIISKVTSLMKSPNLFSFLTCSTIKKSEKGFMCRCLIKQSLILAIQCLCSKAFFASKFLIACNKVSFMKEMTQFLKNRRMYHSILVQQQLQKKF